MDMNIGLVTFAYVDSRELIGTERLHRYLTIDSSEGIWDLLPPVPRPKLEKLLDKAAAGRSGAEKKADTATAAAARTQE
ncbi:hypothetical protein BG006_000833 [Podila minutissima]|uniref:Uncharacterized protein n=1 Tax=Podila minutissima TaxID=64525 RepID=A0A9P5SDQ7_9FUNG|nr:hypothetical protein BG006_000833 [Podila minutissima]